MRRDEYALEVHARRGTGRNTKASAGGGNPRVPESPPASTVGAQHTGQRMRERNARGGQASRSAFEEP